jgi:hypothetical protein
MRIPPVALTFIPSFVKNGSEMQKLILGVRRTGR